MMNIYQIPFNRASTIGNESQYMSEAIKSGHICGDGRFTALCSQILEKQLYVPKVFLTTSCTHALDMSAILLNIKSGDEVIVPSFTFVSTINAFVLQGAKPVFIDIRPDTLNLDETQIEPLITPKTKAILLVHYAGVGCEMDEITAIADRHGIPIVEDNAHGLFGKYRGKYLGTFGCFATQSFHETKNITCGEGGALLINDPTYIERAEIIREKGTNRSQLFRGMVDKYTWVDIGSSYLPSEILAAFLYGQLEKREMIQKRRQEIWESYNESLSRWAENTGVRLPTIPSHCEQSFHMFYLIMPALSERQRLIQHLKTRGILSVFHYLPLHLSKMGIQFGGKKGDCPVTEDLSDRILRLPFFNSLRWEEQEEVIDAINKFR